MQQQGYSVVFTGTVKDGESVQAVQARLGRIFGGKPQTVARLFTGKAVVIRSGLTLEEARRYRDAFSAAGAVCRIVGARPNPGRPAGSGLTGRVGAPERPTLQPQHLPRLFKGSIPRVPVTSQYRLGLAGVAVVMATLLLTYLGMVTGLGLTVFWYGLNALPFALAKPGWFAALIYFAGLTVGGIVLLFLLKPVFSTPVRQLLPLDVTPRQEPLFFAFVEQICALVGAPRPRSIYVDCEVNAAASFRRGISSFKDDELTLTVGLPLFAALDTRQLAGILAHEFGHFSQGAGMRATYLIRAISHWFHRCVRERDSWDMRLEQLSRDGEGALGLVFAAARAGVGLVRLALSGLARAADLVGHYMLRQMEFDADHYAALVAGSGQLRTTSYRIRLMEHAFADVYRDLGEIWAERRLVDDIPSVVAAKAGEMEPLLGRHIELEMQESQTRVFDTHPADSERIQRAEHLQAEGVFTLALPATVLLSDYAALARRATARFYRVNLGLRLSDEQLVSTEQMATSVAAARQRDEALDVYCRELFLPYRFLAPQSPELYADLSSSERRARLDELVVSLRKAMPELGELVENYKRTGEQMVPAYFAYSLTLDKMDLGLTGRMNSTAPELEGVRDSLHRVQERLAPFDRLLTQRFAIALAPLLGRPGSRPSGAPEVARLLQVQAALSKIQGVYDDIYREHAVLFELTSAAQEAEAAGEGEPRTVVPARVIQARTRYLREALQTVESSLAKVLYPFERAGGTTDVVSHLREEMPGDTGHEPMDTLQYAAALFRALQELHVRVMGRLAYLASQSEAELGVQPIKMVVPAR